MTSIHPPSSVLTPPQSPKSAAAAAMVVSTDSTTTNGSASPLTHILMLYQKATSAFLLRQLSVAFSTCLEAQELLSRTNLDYGLDLSDNLNTRRSYLVLKQKLWILHVSVFGAMLSERHQAEQQGLGIIHTTTTTTATNATSGGGRKRLSGSSAKDNPEKLVKDLWRRLVEDYGGVEGDIDGQVVVPFVVLCINQKLLLLARQIIEAYLSTMPEGLLIHLEAAAGALTPAADPKDPLMTTYERLAELYLIHVLAKLGEWDYARQFLSYNTIISVSSKKAYSRIIDKLHQKSLKPKKKTTTATAKETKAKVDQHGNRGADSAGSPALGSPASLSGESVGMSSSVPSGMSTMVSSPVLRSEMGTSLATEASIPSLLTNGGGGGGGAGAGAGAGAGNMNGKTTTTTTKTTSASRPIKTRSVGNRSMATASSSSSSSSSSSTTSSSQLATIQSKVWIVVQHYVTLIRQASSKMGSQQLMMVVAMVVFLGALSRNRARASQVIRTATLKVMQTIKMGTTVTSL
ncbi:hypothetical protein DFQ27_007961 [Actinomortierella ambigua]|uniref:Uncharacterized protein n=1 Tax=Actinomortierella ambigua TaxID=1343610 RepID=A0A9P6PUZ8_9FUNG|nr:hypothetical protein DFQ27_007961 [Actinomortierella ambigua]